MRGVCLALDGRTTKPISSDAPTDPPMPQQSAGRDPCPAHGGLPLPADKGVLLSNFPRSWKSVITSCALNLWPAQSVLLQHLPASALCLGCCSNRAEITHWKCCRHKHLDLLCFVYSWIILIITIWKKFPNCYNYSNTCRLLGSSPLRIRKSA